MRNANAQRIIRKNTASPIGRLGQALSDYPPPQCRCRSRAQAADATHVKAHRSAAGAKGGLRPGDRSFAWWTNHQAARAGRRSGAPRVLLLSSGNTNDISLAAALIAAAGKFQRLIADRGYDAGHLRRLLAERGVACGAGSRTGDASPPDTTNWLETISPALSSLPPLPTGSIESGPWASSHSTGPSSRAWPDLLSRVSSLALTAPGAFQAG